MNILVIKSPGFELGVSKLTAFEKECPGVEIFQLEAGEIKAEHIKKADIIFGWAAPAMLKEAENLKWLHLPSAGVEAYTDMSIYANKDIILTRSKDVFNIQIAEHVIMLFLALSRGLREGVISTAEGKWRHVSGQMELTGSKVLIVGAGGIGGELAKRLKGFDCQVVGIRRSGAEKSEYFDEMYTEKDIEKLLPEADYVALCLPNTPQTKGMFDYSKFSLMKRSAVIVNIGRGEAIVSNDMARALEEGLIAGAGLDVTDPEPLPEGHCLWKAPNIIITSHTSGGSIYSNDRRFDLFFDLFKRYLAGKSLDGVVDFTRGY